MPIVLRDVAPATPPLLPLIWLFDRRSPVLVAAAVTVALGATGSVALLVGAMLHVPAARLWDSAVQLWSNCLAFGYAIGIVLYESRQLAAALETLQPAVEAAYASDPRLFDRNHRPKTLAAVSLLGAALGVLFTFQPGDILYELVSGRHPDWEYAWTPPVLALLWCAVFHVLWVLLGHALLLARIAREGVRVDLTRLDVFDPIANAGIRHLLLIVVGLTVIPVQAILTGHLEPVDFVPALAVVLPVGLLVLAMPIYGAHRAIRAAQCEELDRIDEEMRHLARHSDRHLLLTLYRHQIANMPAWPLSLRAVGRVLAYLVIPPLAWLAAALVENSLANWL